MVRASLALIAGLAVALPLVRAADDAPAGTYKVFLPFQVRDAKQPIWLVKLEAKDGSWEGKVLATAGRFPKATLQDIQVDKGVLRMRIKMDDGTFKFEAALPKDAAEPIRGNISLQDQVNPIVLEPTTLTSLDPFDVMKDGLGKQTGHEAVLSALSLLSNAAAKKAKVEDVRSWAAKASKGAELYGARWQQDVILTLAGVLAEEKDYAPVAVQYARQAERALDPKAPAALQKKVLDLLVTALKNAGKEDEAKEVEARIAKIDVGVKPTPFAGRKGKSDRVVLVELFTGAECPPCVAADLAFDGLAKGYKPSEVIQLQYHLHIPGPDPLTNPSAEERQRFYGRDVGGTPAIFFNGKAAAPGGGAAVAAQEKYDEYAAVITPLLETPSKAKLKATATRKGDKIAITAEYSDVAEPSDDVKLRIALVEEEVTYKGGNKLPTHHAVVRAFAGPSGADGKTVKTKEGKLEATLDLAEVRKKLTTYLDEAAKKEEFPNKDRPMDLKKLRVVAFIQNDDTSEVYQATQVDVKSE